MKKTRRPRAQITDSQAAFFRARYEAGEDAQAIGRAEDLHPRAVAAAIVRAGGVMRTREQAASLRAGLPRSAEHRAAIAAARMRELQDPARRADLARKSKLGAEKIRLSDDERAARNKARAYAKNLIHRALQVTGAHKAGRTQELVGYCWRTLRTHVEAQFQPGMSWDMPGSFHLDHRVPVVAFLKRGVTNPRLINALSNLQVMTKKANLEKSYRYDDANWESDFAAIKRSVYGE